MTRGGKIAGDIFGTLGGVVLAILGIGLIFFWIVGTWMNSTSYLAAGVACIAVGAYVAWYFGR
jgi:hypothetical protein